MDDNSDMEAAARWFEDASWGLAAQILALLKAGSESDYPCLPSHLVTALHRSTLEKVEAALGRSAWPTNQVVTGAGEGPPRATVQHSSLPEGRSSQDVTSNTAKQKHGAKAAARETGRKTKTRAPRRQDSPDQMDLIEFLSEQTRE